MARGCGLEGCSRPHYAAGYCNPHWRRWKRNGDPGAVEIQGYGGGACRFDPCERPSSADALCATHYAQQQRGRPLAPIREHGNPKSTRELRLRATYNISMERYASMLMEQDGGCALCGGVNASGRELAVDHDHACCAGPKSCGRCVRALLCSGCNFGIGSLRDDPELLIKAAEYIRCHRS